MDTVKLTTTASTVTITEVISFVPQPEGKVHDWIHKRSNSLYRERHISDEL